MPRHLSRATPADADNALSGLPEIYQLQKLLLRAMNLPLPSISIASYVGLPFPPSYGVAAQRSPSSPRFPNNSSPHPRSRSSHRSIQRSNSHAPIHILPPEILGEIFMFCVETVFSPFVFPSAPHPPMLMCQVCRYWRSIMLSMPMMWDSFSTRRRNYGQSDLPLYKMWLGRSRLAPLWLEILELEERSPDFFAADAIFALFMSEIRRWRFVRFHLETQHLFDHFLAIPDNAASMLNGLELDVARKLNTEDQLSALISTISNFRALQQISLAVASLPPSMTDIPWEQMTHIKISVPLLASDCLGILARCRLVIYLFLGRIKHESNETTSDSILLPHLRSMVLFTFCDPSLLLRHLTLPVLTRMEIDGHEFGRFRDDVAFNEFIRRTPQLKHLAIEDISCEVEQILAYFNMGAVRRVPSVYFRLSGHEYYFLRARPDMADKKFRFGSRGIRYYVGWTSQLDMELGADIPRDWKRAFWDHLY